MLKGKGDQGPRAPGRSLCEVGSSFEEVKVKTFISKGDSTFSGNGFEPPKLVLTRRLVGNKIIKGGFHFRTLRFLLNVNYFDFCDFENFFNNIMK